MQMIAHSWVKKLVRDGLGSIYISEWEKKKKKPRGVCEMVKWKEKKMKRESPHSWTPE